MSGASFITMLGPGGLVDVRPATYVRNTITSALTSLTFSNTGYVVVTDNEGTATNRYPWKLQGAVGDYYLYVLTPSSGTFSTHAGLNTSLVLSADRAYTVNTTGTKSVTATFQLRNAATTVLDSADITLTASVLPPTGTLAVTASNVSRSQIGYNTCGVVTSLANATNTTVTGGSGVYTYAWTRLSGDSLTISSATAQNPTFSATVCDTGSGGSKNATYQVVVTDGTTGDTAWAAISVTLTWYYDDLMA